MEPLLGAVDLPFHHLAKHAVLADGTECRAIDWVVLGGESGKGARPMHPDWARSVRDQCAVAGVPFFFKQWGGKTSKSGGNELDGRRWMEYPVPKATQVSEAQLRLKTQRRLSG